MTHGEFVRAYRSRVRARTATRREWRAYHRLERLRINELIYERRGSSPFAALVAEGRSHRKGELRRAHVDFELAVLSGSIRDFVLASAPTMRAVAEVFQRFNEAAEKAAAVFAAALEGPRNQG